MSINNNIKQVNVHEAKTHLSRLLEQVSFGEEIIIAKGNEPIAKLVPFKNPKEGRRNPGRYKNQIWIADDFDLLPSDLMAEFEKGFDE